ESPFADALRELVNCAAKEPCGIPAHVFDGINAKAIDIGIGDPIPVAVDEMSQGWRVGRVFARPVHFQIQLLQIKDICLGKLGIVIPIRDMPAAHVIVRLLEFPRPDRSFWPSSVEYRRIDSLERQDWFAILIAESFDCIGLPVPPRILYPIAIRIPTRISNVLVAEDVSAVIKDDIENAIDPLLMCRINKITKVVSCSKVRINFKKILNAVAVVARLEGHLLEHRTDPYRCHTETA